MRAIKLCCTSKVGRLAATSVVASLLLMSADVVAATTTPPVPAALSLPLKPSPKPVLKPNVIPSHEAADVVVTGRVTDAALVTGPAAWWHGWKPDDLDRLAGFLEDAAEFQFGFFAAKTC